MADTPPKGQLPYVMASGTITKALTALKAASTPPRFTLDFLETKLAIKGGSGRPVVPFLKRTGFLATDGSPTEIYKRFRNSSSSGKAAAEALRIGYSALYEINEYCHDLDDKALKGIIVQVTGSAEGSSTVAGIVASFKALKAFARFDESDEPNGDFDSDDEEETNGSGGFEERSGFDETRRRLGISYTINLNLPATSDVAVFNAIFKALNEHLLKS